MFDPEACGARCDVCFLRDRRSGDPVPMEWHDSPASVITGAPREQDVQQGRPLVGRAGQEMEQALQMAGVQRKHLNYHFVVACRPPNNDLKKLITQWRAENRRREKRGEAPRPSPMACCAPRLARELTAVTKVIVFGATAQQALVPDYIDDHTARRKSVWKDANGALLYETCSDGMTRRIVATPPPSYVLRKPRWRPMFRRAVARAARWFAGQLQWIKPEIVHNPTADEYVAFVRSLEAADFAAYDTETDHLEPMIANLRTIQVGTSNKVLVPQILGTDGVTRYYSDADLTRIMEATEWALC